MKPVVVDVDMTNIHCIVSVVVCVCVTGMRVVVGTVMIIRIIIIK